MKMTLIASLFFSMSCCNMELVNSSGEIDALCTKLNLEPEIIDRGKGLPEDVKYDPQHLLKLSRVIKESRLEPLLKNKISQLFEIVDPFYQKTVPSDQEQLRKEILNELKKYLSIMILHKLLSENLQSISQVPEQLIYNNQYYNFLSNIKTHCLNKSKDTIKQLITVGFLSGLPLAYLNNCTYITALFKNEESTADLETFKLACNLGLVCLYGIGASTSIICQAYSYLTFSRKISKL